MLGHFRVERLLVRPALESEPVRIDIDLPAGGAVVMQGPSGSGKTTFLRMLARLRPAEEGEVFLDGRSWREIDPREWRRRVLFVPSNPHFPEGSVAEALRVPFSLKIARGEGYPEGRVEELAGRLRLPEKLMQRETRVLSDGERARFCLLRSLLVRPQVLLADEPTSALDKASRDALLGLLAELREREGLSLLVVAHDGEVAERLGARIIRPWEEKA
jgi:putative ABC transport system ATP-binding protein